MVDKRSASVSSATASDIRVSVNCDTVLYCIVVKRKCCHGFLHPSDKALENGNSYPVLQ